MNISVVIITKNNRASLMETCKMFFSYYQDRKLEFIVVEAIEEKEFDWPGIKYIKIPLDQAGFSKQRNIGVKNASGDTILFVDDDVSVTKDWLDNLLETFSQHPDLIGAWGAVFPKNPSLVGFCEGVMGHPGGGFRLHHFAGNEVIKLPQLNSCNTVLKKPVIEQAGYFNEKCKHGEDTEISIRIAEKFGRDKFGFNPKAVVFHNPRNSISKIIPWYIRRGEGDIEILSHHKSHLKYIIQSSLLLKIAVIILLSVLFNPSLIIWAGIIWYLWQQKKHGFMFGYFSLYQFSPAKRIATFLLFPLIKFIADSFFDFGRIKRIFQFSGRSLREKLWSR